MSAPAHTGPRPGRGPDSVRPAPIALRTAETANSEPVRGRVEPCGPQMIPESSACPRAARGRRTGRHRLVVWAAQTRWCDVTSARRRPRSDRAFKSTNASSHFKHSLSNCADHKRAGQPAGACTFYSLNSRIAFPRRMRSRSCAGRSRPFTSAFGSATSIGA